MHPLNNMNTLLYGKNDFIKFFSTNSNGLSYLMNDTLGPLELFSEEILEFDLDIDNEGNIGVILLDPNGRLFYYFFHEESWSEFILYELDLSVERIKNISIKFSNNSPYILCCWQNLSSPTSWSILSYHKHNDNWKSEIISKIQFLYGEDIKPYKIIRDSNYNLYLIYLTNSNIIYDLNIKFLLNNSFQWKNQLFLCNCIYLKYFQLDGLVDKYGGIHISWMDKSKNKHCIKYLYKSRVEYKPATPITIIEKDSSFLRNLLFMEKDSIICYCITDQHIYYSTKLLKSINTPLKWSDCEELEITPNCIDIFKTICHPDNLFISYHANYILTNDFSHYVPIHSSKIVNKINTNSLLHNDDIPISTEKNKSNFPFSDKQYIQLLEKKQELDIKKNILKSLENQISLLNKEINKVSTNYEKNIKENSPLENMKNDLQEYTANHQENSKNDLTDSLQNLIKTIEEVQINYTSINQSLEKVNQKQKENKEKINDLFHQYSIVNEYLKKINTNPLTKLLNYFK